MATSTVATTGLPARRMRLASQLPVLDTAAIREAGHPGLACFLVAFVRSWRTETGRLATDNSWGFDRLVRPCDWDRLDSSSVVAREEQYPRLTVAIRLGLVAPWSRVAWANSNRLNCSFACEGFDIAAQSLVSPCSDCGLPREACEESSHL